MANFFKNLFDKKRRVEKIDVARRFELLARFGQGSMSKVWRARDVMNGRMLAIKVLDKMKTERFESRFLGLKKPSEGEIAISLQHPNIVKTWEFGTTTDDEQYLMMDFVEGLSLSYLVDTQNEQMRDNCLNYIIQLGDAVDYLHKQNWIHRDLCPRNVMIDRDNIVKLIDFGLVVPNTATFQKPGNRTGTANYMAPELIKRQRTDQRIDIFSFSVTAYEMYTKRLPWDVPDQETLDTVLQHINKPPKPIEQLATHIDPRVAEVLMKGLLPNPDDRWQTMAELLVPLCKAHEEIEAKRCFERKMRAATAKAKAKSTPAAEASSKKQKDDDAFFEQILLGEGQTRADKRKKKLSAASKKSMSASGKRESPDAAAKSRPMAKTASTGLQTSPGKTSNPQSDSPKAPIEEPDIVVEDEFDGIEIEEEGHKLDDRQIAEKSSDEFSGIEIEEDRDFPVDVATHTSGSGHKLATLLDEDRSASLKPDRTAADDDDEPVLRLPDDD